MISRRKVDFCAGVLITDLIVSDVIFCQNFELGGVLYVVLSANANDPYTFKKYLLATTLLCRFEC